MIHSVIEIEHCRLQFDFQKLLLLKYFNELSFQIPCIILQICRRVINLELNLKTVQGKMEMINPGAIIK